MKSNSHLGIFIFGLLLVFSSFEIEARVGSLFPPQCDPKYEGTMPDAIKNLCKSVARLWEMSNDMEDDLDQNGKKFETLKILDNNIRYNISFRFPHICSKYQR